MRLEAFWKAEFFFIIDNARNRKNSNFAYKW